MGSEARRQARSRLKEERERAKKRAQRTRVLVVIGAAALVVLLVVGVGYLLLNADRQSAVDFEGALPTQTLQEDGSVVLAREGAQAPVVEVYADYQCPACRQFENLNGDTLKQFAADGEAIVHYRPVSIFAQQPEPVSSNSLRAAAAARTAADHGAFVEYNDILFANQPSEGRAGYSAEELVQWGEDAGIEDTAAFADRIEAESATVDRFTGTYLPELMERAARETGQEQPRNGTLADLMAWGEENGMDASFLEDTHTGEILEATSTAYTRYSGADTFRGTPAVYINGQLLSNDRAMTVRGLTSAITSAGAGQVDTRPLAVAGGAE